MIFNLYNTIGNKIDDNIYEFVINNPDIINDKHLLLNIETDKDTFKKCPYFCNYNIEDEKKYGIYEESKYEMKNIVDINFDRGAKLCKINMKKTLKKYLY